MPARGGEDGGTVNGGAKKKTRSMAMDKEGVVFDGQEKGGGLPTIPLAAAGKRAVWGSAVSAQ